MPTPVRGPVSASVAEVSSRNTGPVSSTGAGPDTDAGAAAEAEADANAAAGAGAGAAEAGRLVPGTQAAPFQYRTYPGMDGSG